MSRKRFYQEYEMFLPLEKRGLEEPTRLDIRYHAIIEHGREAIKGARILDIASHNGRWSIAALHNGAAHVLGVEGRQTLLDDGIDAMQHYGVPESQYTFIVGDVHKEIVRFEPNQFDTILCLGFFYHTAHHFLLLEEFERLAPKHLILDTGINQHKDHVITMRREDTSNPLRPIGEKPLAWSGFFSKSLLEDALVDHGFAVSYFDWTRLLQTLGEPIPRFLTDYAKGNRITIHARRVQDA